MAGPVPGLPDTDQAGGAPEPGWDFFVSYTRVDAAWAEWIAWQLEEAGYRVLIQKWDMVVGTHWMATMQEGMARAQRTIAVVSAAYLASVYGQQEWQAAVQADPRGFARKLLPIRLEKCPRPGLLGQIVSTDLFDVSEDTARQHLLDTIGSTLAGRAKPTTPPAFPAARPPTAPAFPRTASNTDDANYQPANGTQHDASPDVRLDATRANTANRVPDRFSALTGLGFVSGMEFSPDGRILATNTSAGRVILWDVRKPSNPIAVATVGRRSGVYAMAFSPDGNTIATIEGGHLLLWDVAEPSRSMLASSLGHRSGMYAMAFSPDGRTIATLGRPKRKRRDGPDLTDLILWDLTQETRFVFRKGRVPAIATHVNGFARSVTFFPDVRTLVTDNLHTNDVILWDAAGATKPVRVTAFGRLYMMHSIAVSPDGGTLAITSRVRNSNDGQMTLWDVGDSASQPTLIVAKDGLGPWINTVTFSPNGCVLATSTSTNRLGDRRRIAVGEVILWDVADRVHPVRITTITGLAAEEIKDHPMAFSPDGGTLATVGGVPGSVILWDVRNLPRS